MSLPWIVFLIECIQIAQFEDVQFEAASLLSELYCQQVIKFPHLSAVFLPLVKQKKHDYQVFLNTVAF